MQAFDLTPLFRSTIGFDRLNDMFDAAFKMDAPSYPPYNIVKKGEDEYEIVMALAGFRKEDLNIVAQENTLTVSAQQTAKEEEQGAQYLHRGIAQRSFERRFQLADHVKVADAEMADGLLTIRLRHEVPEAAKPRTIAIKGSGEAAKIGHKKAA